MRRKRFALPVAFVGVAAAVLIMGMSAQGSTRTLAFNASNCGTTITSSITLTGNVDCSATAATAITIGADGVTINLNGHTLWGNPSYDCIDASGYNHDTVTSGTLSQCSDGVYAEYGDGFNVTGVTISAPASEGVYYYYMGSSAVKGSTITNAVNEGIDFEYGASNSATSNTVSNSTNDPYQLYIYYEEGDGFTGNKLTFTTQQSSSSAYNIYSDEGLANTYASNTMTNGYYGLYLDCDDYGPATITGNTASNNYYDGFYIEDCYDDYGYYGSTGGHLVVSGNTAFGSSNDYGFEDYYNPGGVWTNNVAKNNYYGGFYFGDEQPDAVLTGNTSSGAADGDGFYFEYAGYEGYGPTVFSKNTATNNSGYGFDSPYEYTMVGTGLVQSGNGSGGCYQVAGC